MRLFLYEYASTQPAGVMLPESVRREGGAMLRAVLEDAQRLQPKVEIVTVPENSVPSMGQFLNEADYALIIAPEFDGILEQCAREALLCGCKLLGPMPEAIELTADKWKLYQHWQRNGVPTPATWLPEQLPTKAGLYLQKHRYGAGSLGVGWWQPGEMVSEQHLIQQYVKGLPVSVALLISPLGKVVSLLPARQVISSDGQFSYLGGSFLTDDSLCDRVVRLARRAVQGIRGLQGYVGVDAIVADSEKDDVVLEINPRLTTSYLGLRQATARNWIQCMLDLQMGGNVAPIKWNERGISWSS